MVPVIAIGAMILVGAALYGWGVVVRRLGSLPAGTWPMTIALGLAGWIFLGGVLNLLRLAYPAALYLSLAIGLFVTIARLRAAKLATLREALWPSERRERYYRILWFLLASTIGVVTIITQLSPTAFNQHDDFQKYFVHVARMVQTGTLFGSPLNALGSETLGAQAFLQGLVVAPFSFAYINAADAVFCLLLTISMAGGLALRRPAIAPVAILAIVFVWFFEPQYVSVTALYSASALIFAIVALTFDPREYGTAAGATASPGRVTGLLYAGLVALKPTFALFAVLHFLACTIAAIARDGSVRTSLRNAIATTLWGAAFIAPWFFLHSPLYYAAIAHPVAGLQQPPVPLVETIDLLSTEMLYYGGSYAQYTFIVVALIVLAGAVVATRQISHPNAARFVGLCLAVAIGYPIMILIMGPLLAGCETALRHFLPILLGAAPAILIAFGQVIPEKNCVRLSAVLLAISIVWFAPDALTRARLLMRTGSELAYLRDASPETIDFLLAFNRSALQSGELQQKIAAQQQRIPANEPVLVWTAAPFLMDFKRNPIVDVDIGGISNPWSRTPPVSYILWQYAGFGVRQPDDYESQGNGPGRRETYLAANAVLYAEHLRDIARRTPLEFNDRQTVLMRVSPDESLP